MEGPAVSGSHADTKALGGGASTWWAHLRYFQPSSSIRTIVPTVWQSANHLAARQFATCADPVDDPRPASRKLRRVFMIQR